MKPSPPTPPSASPQRGRVIQGPWLPRTRCDGCAKTFPEGHILGPIYFRGEPYWLCFGCDGENSAALLSVAQQARKRAGRTP